MSLARFAWNLVSLSLSLLESLHVVRGASRAPGLSRTAVKQPPRKDVKRPRTESTQRRILTTGGRDRAVAKSSEKPVDLSSDKSGRQET